MTTKILLKPEELEVYIQRGLEARPQMLSRAITRRCYYDWFKNEADLRDWDEVFEARLEKYRIRFEKAVAKREAFVPRKIGRVEISNDKLVITSQYHHDLVVIPKKLNKGWINKIVSSYARKNVCSIDLVNLMSTKSTDIYTKVWI